MFVLDYLYRSIRQEELKKSKNVLKRIKVDLFYEALTKCCWNYGVQYETIIKNYNYLEIKLKGKKEEKIIKFHRTIMVFKEDYDSFLYTLDSQGVSKGIYITIGVFENTIKKHMGNFFLSNNKILLVDGISFAQDQLGWNGKAFDMLKSKKIRLHGYLPV